MTTTRPQVRLRTAADIVATIPRMLGYQPVNQVAVMLMREGRLYAIGGLGEGEPLEGLPDILKAAREGQVDGYAIAGYAASERTRDAVAADLRDVDRALARAGPRRVLAAVAVDGVATVATDAGTDLVDVPPGHTAPGAAAAFGTPDPSRAALESRLEPGDRAGTFPLPEATPSMEGTLHAWTAIMLAGTVDAVSDGDLGVALAGCRDLGIRDQVITSLAPGMGVPASPQAPQATAALTAAAAAYPGQELRRLLADVAACATEGDRVPVCTILGSVALAGGDVTVAAMATLRALRVAPRTADEARMMHAAVLLRTLIENAWRPPLRA